MSLEIKIEKLTTAVELLTAKIETLTTQAQLSPVPTSAPELEKVEKPKAEKNAVVEVAQAPVQVDVTEQELMDLCISIVRRDRNLKNKIKGIIESHGGKVVSEVKPSSYAALKAELEAL